ncbi:hypothetical protein ACWD4L_46285 [Streptomyces sp. NPDC002596]
MLGFPAAGAAAGGMAGIGGTSGTAGPGVELVVVGCSPLAQEGVESVMATCREGLPVRWGHDGM